MIKSWLKKISILRRGVSKIKLIKKRYDINAANRNYKNTLKKLSSQSESIKVYFLITQKQLWGATDLFKKIEASKNFEPVIVVFPNFEDSVRAINDTYNDNKKFFVDLGLSVVDGCDSHCRLLSPAEVMSSNGIIFFDQPWPQLGNKWSFKNLSKNFLICYIPYGFKIANNYAGHFSQDIHNMAWRLFIETPWHQKKFSELSLAEGNNVEITGYPKLDSYLNSTTFNSNTEIKSILSKAKSRKIIIWAPHWSMHDGLLNYSTFDLFYDQFMLLRERRKDLFFIFKPHQRLRYFAQEANLLNSIEVNDYYDGWLNSENSSIYNEADYIELFKNSDAMITDSGSFLAEYLPSGNPLLLLKSADTVGYNKLGEALVSNYYQSMDWSGVEKFVESVIDNGVDPMREMRQKFLNEIWDPVKGSSSERIFDHLFKSIYSRSGN